MMRKNIIDDLEETEVQGVSGGMRLHIATRCRITPHLIPVV